MSQWINESMVQRAGKVWAIVDEPWYHQIAIGRKMEKFLRSRECLEYSSGAMCAIRGGFGYPQNERWGGARKNSRAGD